MSVEIKESQTKGEMTRIAIEDAAIELFMEQGYHATSMRQIAERTELALGGIYNHFSSKEDIFQAIIIDKHPYKKVLPAILEAEGETVEEFLHNAAHIVVKELKSQPYYIKLMLIEIVEFNGKHGALLIKEIAPKALPIFEKIVKSRRNLRVTHPALLLRSFIGMILSYMLTEIIMSNSILQKLMPKNAADAYVDIYLHGILKPE
ncbi:MAG: TetR/AcrR family transcriptional regulator, partial [Anaerolineales bacterium]|nr:TetR/AcrR family transcriptional regulator [Anaerolineales bacterium]